MRVSLRTALVIAALAAPPALIAAADVLSQIGITPEAAREAVGSLLTAGIYNPGLPSKVFKAMPPAARAQAATAGVAWVKAYVASADFRKQYAQLREQRKPQAPAYEMTPEQEARKADDEQQASLEESKKAIASLPPDQRKAMEEALKQAAAVAAQMDTPAMKQMRLDGIKADRAGQAKDYAAGLAKWKTDYPEDARPLVAARLREFLQASADVDFAARLKTQSGTSTFENPAYQAKPSQWKLCYRAGRDATMAARTAVQAWLKELGG